MVGCCSRHWVRTVRTTAARCGSAWQTEVQGRGRSGEGRAAVSELVTGDAVVLGLRPARLPSRALAVLHRPGRGRGPSISWCRSACCWRPPRWTRRRRRRCRSRRSCWCWWAAPIAVETLSHGRSLGKLACGLRVVRDDGGPIRFRHALVRGAIGVVEILMIVRRRRLHRFAGVGAGAAARGRVRGDAGRTGAGAGRGGRAVRAASAAVAGRAVRGARSVGGAGRSVARDTPVPDADAAAGPAGELVDGGAAGRAISRRVRGLRRRRGCRRRVSGGRGERAAGAGCAAGLRRRGAAVADAGPVRAPASERAGGGGRSPALAPLGRLSGRRLRPRTRPGRRARPADGRPTPRAAEERAAPHAGSRRRRWRRWRGPLPSA